MKIRPLRGLVLIAIDPDPTVSHGGVTLASLTGERPKIIWGEVLAVGPGDWSKNDTRRPVCARPGMRVGIARHHAFAELEQREPAEAGRELIMAHDKQLQLEELSATS